MTGNNGYINVARKLQESELRYKYTIQELQDGGNLKFLGLTKRPVGPPLSCNADDREKWDVAIQKCMRNCVRNILQPTREVELRKRKEDFVKIIDEKLEILEEKQVRKEVLRGFGRAQKKWKKRNVEANLNLPSSWEFFGRINLDEVGTIKRGELRVSGKEFLMLDKRIKEKKDLFKVIAFSIYGRSRWRNIVVRNIWKYIRLYYEIEKEKFVPHYGYLKNGLRKWIGSWVTFCALLRNRDLCVTTYEVDIISKLYDVNVRIYKVNNSDDFRCLWQTARNCNRVVDLCLSGGDEWSLLISKVRKEADCKSIAFFSTISDSIDSFGNVALVNKDMSEINSTQSEISINKQSRWSLISSDTEDFKELEEIGNRVNQQKVVSIVGCNLSDITDDTSSDSNSELREIEHKVSHYVVQNFSELNFSNITCSTDSFNSRDIVLRDNQVVYDNEAKDERRVRREKLIGRDRELLDSNYNIVDENKTIVANCTNTIKTIEKKSNNKKDIRNSEDSINSILNLDIESVDGEAIREIGLSKSHSMDSMSSMEEEIKWLFEEVNRDNRLEVSKHEELIVANRKEVANRSSKDKNELVVDFSVSNGRKSSRREFWQKWKNAIRNRNRIKYKKHEQNVLKEGIQQRNIDSVFDFYSKGLDKIEIELLSKGSTFCVANNRLEEDKFKADIYAYSRRLRLHDEYREHSAESDYSQIFSQILREQRNSQDSNNTLPSSNKPKKDKGRKLPSTYDPDSQNRNLARYCSCIQEESVLAINTKIEFKDNITKEHRKALNMLKRKVEEKEVVITLADKGSGIVVVDYDKYIQKGTKYIEEEAQAYSLTCKSSKEIIKDIVMQRNKIVKKLREYEVIGVDTATYCMKQLEEKVTGMKFYYKVHKDNNIDTMPLRPLQSCIGSPTHHLSQVLTDILQPFLTSDFIPIYIQDSNQLMFRLSNLGKLEEDNTLISSDVAALYPSIPHEQGLAAVKTFLIDYSEYNNAQVKFIMQALELVITQNYVMWNGKIYGTPVAVAYANIFMDWIDRQLRHRAPYIIEHIRYIDDNLFIIPEDRIEDLMLVANAILPPHIRFTYDKLDKTAVLGLPFLDTQLFISEELTIESRLYTKKTDKHTYLLPSSFHPSHITKNIPMAVFNRIRRLCSKYEWFLADAMLAMQWLEDRGYKYGDIKRAIEISSKKDRWIMINKIEENRINKIVNNVDKDKIAYEIPLIMTYSHNAKLVKEVLKKRQPLLDASFSQTVVKPRLAYRRQKNINDILIQKGLSKPILGKVTEERGLELCGVKPRYRINCPCRGTHDQHICRCCAHMKLKLDNIEPKLHKIVNCESKNLIYVIGCKICNKLYVGETQQQLKERFLQHLNNIFKLSQPLYIHFSKVHKAEHIYIYQCWSQ